MKGLKIEIRYNDKHVNRNSYYLFILTVRQTVYNFTENYSPFFLLPELEGFLDDPDGGDCELEPATGSLLQDLLSPLLVSQVEGFPVYDVASSLCENRVN